MPLFMAATAKPILRVEAVTVVWVDSSCASYRTSALGSSPSEATVRSPERISEATPPAPAYASASDLVRLSRAPKR